jgi:hypothetical protein
MVTMERKKTSQTEEDIRVKVVYTWLVDHGFGLDDIKLECPFDIHLGRNVFRIGSKGPEKVSSQMFRPRADVLVRSSDGRNLLIVEVKAPSEPLDDNAKKQGISYARLLEHGAIAPFVVLTNGNETKIYDSISGDQIEGTSIPLDHSHVKAGFRISVDDIALRAEALETFISLSPENLIEFCRQQVFYRMRLLRSNDPFSGKKYIPNLYVERAEAKEMLTKLVDETRRKVVVLTGQPQVGKTNFICHSVEERLAHGMPCLFYPAIGIGRGLLEAICEDFEWIIGDKGSPYHIVHNKLTRILRHTGQRLVIFIDGLNEADLTLVRAIDQESERLSSYDITVVVSMTNVAARRLLFDDAGNPSHIAEAAGIGSSAIPLIEISPEKYDKSWSKVYIGKYTSKERDEAYSKYAEVFDVYVPQEKHQFVDDPFLLRIGMEAFQGKALPHVLDEPDLLKQSIEMKALRAPDLRGLCVPVLLSKLADEMFSQDAPLEQSRAMSRWQIPLIQEPPSGLFEAALLARVSDERGLPSLDFYYSRERDFSVACWARNWPDKLRESEEVLISEISLAAQTRTGIDALRWFLKQPKYEEYLRESTEYFSSFRNPLVRSTLLSSLWSVYYRNRENSIWMEENEDWIQAVIDEGISDPDIFVKIEAAKLLVIRSEGTEDIEPLFEDTEIFKDNLEKLIVKLLSIEEEYPLEVQSASSVILDVLQSFHTNLGGQDDGDTEIALILERLLCHESLFIRRSAAKGLGYIAPVTFLTRLSRTILANLEKVSVNKVMEYSGSIASAAQSLEKRYIGSPMCRSYLEFLDEQPEELCKEYKEMSDVCAPIVAIYSSEPGGKMLLNIVKSLQPDKDLLKSKGLLSVDELIQEYSHLMWILSPYRQLPLPFEDLYLNASED